MSLFSKVKPKQNTGNQKLSRGLSTYPQTVWNGRNTMMITSDVRLKPCRKTKAHPPHTYRSGTSKYRCVGVGTITEDQLAALASDVLKDVVEAGKDGTRYKDLPEAEKDKVATDMAALFKRLKGRNRT